MSQINTQIIASVNKVIGNTHFTTCTLSISPEKLNYDELLKKIEAFEAEQGWIAYQSENIAFTNKDDCTKTLKKGGVSNKGKILSAELTKPAQSISIRHLKGDQWQMTTFTEGEGEGKRVDCLSDTITHHATAGLGKLSYLRLWQDTETKQGYEPFASYFTGFEEERR